MSRNIFISLVATVIIWGVLSLGLFTFTLTLGDWAEHTHVTSPVHVQIDQSQALDLTQMRQSGGVSER